MTMRIEFHDEGAKTRLVIIQARTPTRCAVRPGRVGEFVSPSSTLVAA